MKKFVRQNRIVIYRRPLLLIIMSVIGVHILYAQQIRYGRHHAAFDSTVHKNQAADLEYLDTLHLKVKNIVISGNDVTKDEIIMRELSLLPGSEFSSEKVTEDRNRIYNLGIFSGVEILPLVRSEKSVDLKIDVQEKWYIYPLPQVSFSDGDVRKITVGGNLRWQNFRGRNENVSMGFGIGYNPYIRASYTVPWIGDHLHLFATISGTVSREKNKSLLALGRESGQQILYYRDYNFEYQNYSAKLTVGKFFSKRFSVYTEAGYTFLRVLDYAENRTFSSDGVDKYVLLGIGLNYDSRDTRDLAAKGYMLHMNLEHYGFASSYVDFGRFTFEQRSYVPINITSDYSLVVANKIFTSLAIGANTPYYNHMFLGYGNEFVRGWARYGFEGDNDMIVHNELRIPVILPSFIRGQDLPIIRSLPYLKKMSYKYGLFVTLFYDFGGVWNQDNLFGKTRILNGTGTGLNVILPFGMIAKLEWAFRLGKPTVGQAIVGIGANF